MTTNQRPVVLIVDDEKNSREGLARALRRSYDVLLAEGAQRALNLLKETPVDVVLSDVRMPGLDGMTLLRRALTKTPPPIVILLTAYGTIEMAVEAMKQGAYDFLPKPVDLDRLDILLQRALRERAMEAENRRLHEQLNSRFGLDEIIGQSAAMQEVFDTIRQVAPTRATVLIQGESGTGKELVARAIHRLSPRNRGPFVAVHCAALSQNLLESELFGHEKGAFTGAVEQRRGRFELADGGTLFLDEIGEIDPSIQVKILRVLEERRFERVGGQETLEVDVRLVAATNRDLKKMVTDGKFREDLFYRLYVVVVQLPPLRERASDIPLLIDHFIKQFAQSHAKPVDGITSEAVELLSAYSWPGNVRELKNVIERMVVLSKGGKLSARDIPGGIKESGARPQGILAAADDLTLEEAEKRLIIRALRVHDGNVTKAAEQLGISRRTLHRKINQYRLKERIPDNNDASPEAPTAPGDAPEARAP
jgi:two-component system response regulator AtoC